MNHTELRTLFLGILNRKDCTQTQADQFLGLGLTRVERLLRTPTQIKTITAIIEGGYSPLVVPSDYLALRTLRVNGIPLRRESEIAFFDHPTGTPENFIFQNGLIHISPNLGNGDKVDMTYYASLDGPTTDLDSTAYSQSFPDLVAYAGLVYAADFFVDERRETFASFMAQLRDEIQIMADMEEMSGMNMQIRNPYEGVA